MQPWCVSSQELHECIMTTKDILIHYAHRMANTIRGLPEAGLWFSHAAGADPGYRCGHRLSWCCHWPPQWCGTRPGSTTTCRRLSYPRYQPTIEGYNHCVIVRMNLNGNYNGINRCWLHALDTYYAIKWRVVYWNNVSSIRKCRPVYGKRGTVFLLNSKTGLLFYWGYGPK